LAPALLCGSARLFLFFFFKKKLPYRASFRKPVSTAFLPLASALKHFFVGYKKMRTIIIRRFYPYEIGRRYDDDHYPIHVSDDADVAVDGRVVIRLRKNGIPDHPSWFEFMRDAEPQSGHVRGRAAAELP
jgi:hypothetical protein